MKISGNDSNQKLESTTADLVTSNPSHNSPKLTSAARNLFSNLLLNSSHYSKKLLPAAAKNGDVKAIHEMLKKHKFSDQKIFISIKNALSNGQTEAFKVLFQKAQETGLSKAIFLNYPTTKNDNDKSLNTLLAIAPEFPEIRSLLREAVVETYANPDSKHVALKLLNHFDEIFPASDSIAGPNTSVLYTVAKHGNAELLREMLKHPVFFYQGKIAHEQVFEHEVEINPSPGTYFDEKQTDTNKIRFVQNILLDMIEKDEVPYLNDLPRLLHAEFNQNTDFSKQFVSQVEASQARQKKSIQ